LQQIAGVGDTDIQLLNGADDGFQGCALAAQGLGPFGLVPDIRITQLQLDLGQAFLFGSVVKGTPSARRCAP